MRHQGGALLQQSDMATRDMNDSYQNIRDIDCLAMYLDLDLAARDMELLTKYHQNIRVWGFQWLVDL